MKAIGWILAVLGGFLCTGFLIMATEPGFNLDGIMALSALIAIVILVVGVVLIKRSK